MDRDSTRADILRDEIFNNPDLLSIIKSNIGCETITSFCLINRNLCEKVSSNNELRIEVARCILIRINDNLQRIRDIMNFEIPLNNHNWNEPGKPLFIEIADTFFSVALQLDAHLPQVLFPEDFISDHPSFNSTVRNTGNLLALLFNVKVSGETTDTDKHDPYYLNKFVGFNQPIPRRLLEKLPFARVVEGHDNQISLSPIPNFYLDAFQFYELLDWPHLRRSLRGHK